MRSKSGLNSTEALLLAELLGCALTEHRQECLRYPSPFFA
jgi:hypothetical protein